MVHLAYIGERERERARERFFIIFIFIFINLFHLRVSIGKIEPKEEYLGRKKGIDWFDKKISLRKKLSIGQCQLRIG